MHLSLLFSLLAFSALARWARDETLVRAAESWRESFLHDRCQLIAGRKEAGRRNIEEAAAALGKSASVPLERWAGLFPEAECQPTAGGLRWDVRQEHHERDQGVNWVMVWREGG